jgi:hypothetical protein
MIFSLVRQRLESRGKFEHVRQPPLLSLAQQAFRQSQGSRRICGNSGCQCPGFSHQSIRCNHFGDEPHGKGSRGVVRIPGQDRSDALDKPMWRAAGSMRRRRLGSGNCRAAAAPSSISRRRRHRHHAIGATGIGCAFRWLFSGTRTSLSNQRPRSDPLPPVVSGRFGASKSESLGKRDWRVRTTKDSIACGN